MTLTCIVDTVIVDNSAKYGSADFPDGGARMDDKSARDAVDLQEKKKLPSGLRSHHIDFPGPTIPCGKALPLSRALPFHDDTSPLTPRAPGAATPSLPEHKPAQSQRSAGLTKTPKGLRLL